MASASSASSASTRSSSRPTARAAQQLRLQLAVEGLSVAAISYYLVGLLGYAGKAAKAAGWPINPDIALGILVPVVAGAVWLAQRRVHHRIGKSA